MNARLFSLIFLFSFVFLTNAKAEERFEFEGIEMAVPIRIVLYAENARTAKKAYLEGITLKEACVGLGYLTAERFDEVFHPEEMI